MILAILRSLPHAPNAPNAAKTTPPPSYFSLMCRAHVASQMHR